MRSQIKPYLWCGCFSISILATAFVTKVNAADSAPQPLRLEQNNAELRAEIPPEALAAFSAIAKRYAEGGNDSRGRFKEYLFHGILSNNDFINDFQLAVLGIQKQNVIGWRSDASYTSSLITPERAERLFSEQVSAIADQIQNSYRPGDPPVILEGHSAGGVLATAIAEELNGRAAANKGTRVPVAGVITYGTPVGALRFHAALPDRVPVLAITSKNDEISALERTLIPPPPSYVGVQVPENVRQVTVESGGANIEGLFLERLGTPPVTHLMNNYFYNFGVADLRKSYLTELAYEVDHGLPQQKTDLGQWLTRARGKPAWWFSPKASLLERLNPKALGDMMLPQVDEKIDRIVGVDGYFVFHPEANVYTKLDDSRYPDTWQRQIPKRLSKTEWNAIDKRVRSLPTRSQLQDNIAKAAKAIIRQQPGLLTRVSVGDADAVINSAAKSAIKTAFNDLRTAEPIVVQFGLAPDIVPQDIFSKAKEAEAQIQQATYRGTTPASSRGLGESNGGSGGRRGGFTDRPDREGGGGGGGAGGNGGGGGGNGGGGSGSGGSGAGGSGSSSGSGPSDHGSVRMLDKTTGEPRSNEGGIGGNGTIRGNR